MQAITPSPALSLPATLARRLAAAGVVSCLVVSQLVWAQAGNGKVLSGKAVTESNLLDALTPAAAAPAAAAGDANGDADVAVRTRSLRVTSNTPAAAVLAPRKKASASLLITFETNSAQLTPRSKEQLDVVAAALKNDRLKDFSFEVEGHADARGAADANQLLSQQRAESVRAYLVGSHSIPEARLRAVGKGDTEPMNTRDVAAAENRRVTITTVTQ
ncbi:MAG: OmpA family protein [Burkholderiales bacterium]|nr:OmpA family protein [Burkholderiales bacterium]